MSSPVPPVKRAKRWQFRLSSLLIAITICALLFSVLFAVLPNYVVGWKIVSGQVLLIQLTPAAQELLFDPPAPMGPMHQTKVVVFRSLAYNAATVFVVVLLILWAAFRLRHYLRRSKAGGRFLWAPARDDGGFVGASAMTDNRPENCTALSRIRITMAGGLTGTLVGGMSLSLVMRTLDGVPQAAAMGCFLGVISGAVMARRGLESACLAAGCVTLVVSALGLILLTGV